MPRALMDAQSAMNGMSPHASCANDAECGTNGSSPQTLCVQACAGTQSAMSATCHCYVRFMSEIFLGHVRLTQASCQFYVRPTIGVCTVHWNASKTEVLRIPRARKDAQYANDGMSPHAPTSGDAVSYVWVCQVHVKVMSVVCQHPVSFLIRKVAFLFLCGFVTATRRQNSPRGLPTDVFTKEGKSGPSPKTAHQQATSLHPAAS